MIKNRSKYKCKNSYRKPDYKGIKHEKETHRNYNNKKPEGYKFRTKNKAHKL